MFAGKESEGEERRGETGRKKRGKRHRYEKSILMLCGDRFLPAQ